MRKTIKWCFSIALLWIGSLTAAAPVQEQTPARQPETALVNRFIWFSATPRPGAKVSPDKMPPVFQQLNSREGWGPR
jgi:hypothetical protein